MARERHSVRAIFDEAAEIGSPADRAVYLEPPPAVATPTSATRSTPCSEPWLRSAASWKIPPPSTR